MSNNKTKIKMVNIEDMMNHLTDLWNKGVEYVDISGQEGEDNDVICFTFCEEYMHEDYTQDFKELYDEIRGMEEEEEEEDIETPKATKEITVKLTDNDINDLI